MNPFERAIMEDRSISFSDAADFFIGIRQPVAYAQEKTAGLTDPPDETGALEGQFEVPVESAVALMQNAINKAMTLLNASLVYSMSLRGVASEPVRRCIAHGDYFYRDVIEYLTKRANTLAGAVHVGDVEPVPPSTDPVTIANSLIRGEQELIHALMELHTAVGCNPMTSRLKSFAANAQERMDDLWRALDPEAKPPTTVAAPNKLLKHEAVESPEQEASESPEFEAAEEAAGVEPPEHAAGESAVIPKQAASEEVFGAARQGILRGITQVEKDAIQAKAERGQRYGKALGSLTGAGGGAALGKKLIGGKKGAIAGLAAGYLGGGGLGKEVGTSADIRRIRKPASKVKTSSILRMRMKVAMMKLAQPPAQGEAAAPMSPPVDTQELQPANYLQAELIGQQAQDAQEAEFYRGQAQQAQTAAQAAQQQMMDLQGQLQQLQMQADQAGQSIQQSQQSAMAAQDEALKQTQVAANMRMGIQKLRAMMMDVASQDPAEVAAQELQAGMGGAPMEGPPPEEGGTPPITPEGGKETEEAERAQTDAAIQTGQAEQKNQEDVAALAPPTAVPPGGGFPPGQEPPQANAAPSGGMDISTLQPASSTKVGHMKSAGQALDQAAQRLPWALAGAGLGAAHHVSLKGSAPGLRSQVEGMQAQGGFLNAMRLAVKKRQLADAEYAEQYPGTSLARQITRGALIGSIAGPSVGSSASRIAKDY